jgi:hypothetical protein
MRVTFPRQRRLMVLSVLAWGWAAGLAAAQASAQESIPAPSLSALMTRVRAGEIVYVTDAGGATLKGRVSAAGDDGVQLYVGRELRRVAGADVREIQREQPDSPLTGVLIGAGIGAIPGIYWLVADPNECTGMCPEDYASIAAGAVIGGLIDRAIRRKVTIYRAGAARDRTVTIAPLLTPSRTALQVAVKF